MTTPEFVFYLTFLFCGEMALTALKSSSSEHKANSFVIAERGENLTLECFYEGDVSARYYWYKQSLGDRPKLISTFYIYERNGTFYNEFKNDPRYSLDTENGKNHLTIRDLHISDSATYYCMSCFLYTLEVSESIVVSVRDSGFNIRAHIHQSVSETIQPGGSVTLNCTVHTGSCAGERSVYWFKSFKESSPGLIYTHGGRNDQCERKPNSQTHTCVFNLLMKNISVTDAGTYYCAVASCGHILFGDGTKLDFDDKAELVYFWSRASAFTTILSIVLAFCLCVMTKRNCHSAESRPAHFTANAEGYRRTENLCYAALSVNLPKRSRKDRDQIWSESVYCRVNQ